MCWIDDRNKSLSEESIKIWKKIKEKKDLKEFVDTDRKMPKIFSNADKISDVNLVIIGQDPTVSDGNTRN